MNDFHTDNEWQRGKRDKYLTHFYGHYSRGGRYVYIEKSRCSTLMQKRLAVDTVKQDRNGGSSCIEEKITRAAKKPHWSFTLETQSCTVPGYESDGWMKYGEADYLLYCFEVAGTLDLDCYLIPFQPLKTWFWRLDFTKYPTHTMPTKNRGRCVLVPTWEVAKAMKVTRFLIDASGAMRKLDPMKNRREESLCKT